MTIQEIIRQEIRARLEAYGVFEGDVVIQLHGTGPWGITYIDPADDPRSGS